MVASENTSLYDDWRRERDSFGLKDLFGLEKPPAIRSIKNQDGGALESIQELELRSSGNTMKNQFGKGKVVYIPSVDPAIKRPPAASMRNGYWKLPLNYIQIVDAIKWAAGAELSIDVQAPLTVTIELTQKETRDKMLLHLINFDHEQNKLVKDINVSLRIPEGKQVRDLILLSPDREETESLTFNVKSGRVIFKVPRLEVYDLVVVDLN